MELSVLAVLIARTGFQKPGIGGKGAYFKNFAKLFRFFAKY